MLIFDARTFAEAWASAWNARDLEAVLSHFADDVVFTSPLAVQISPASGGIVRGKEALSAYWSAALARNPALHFDITGVFAGVDCVVIRFRTEAALDRIEILRFCGGLVVEGHGTFALPYPELDGK